MVAADNATQGVAVVVADDAAQVAAAVTATPAKTIVASAAEAVVVANYTFTRSDDKSDRFIFLILDAALIIFLLFML